MPTAEQFDRAYQVYRDYVVVLRKFVDAMSDIGIMVRNVEPFANFAEVIVAREFDGEVQRATNKGFDVMADGVRIQVKSLRVSSANPGDNWIDWIQSTRARGQKCGELIEADRLSVVVYLDFQPYALVDFPIELRETFPTLNLKGLFFSHVEKMLDGRLPIERVHIIDLRSFNLPKTPPAISAVGE